MVAIKKKEAQDSLWKNHFEIARQLSFHSTLFFVHYNYYNCEYMRSNCQSDFSMPITRNGTTRANRKLKDSGKFEIRMKMTDIFHFRRLINNFLIIENKFVVVFAYRLEKISFCRLCFSVKWKFGINK